MFGYVRAYKPELRFKEYETYKALYCSLCRTMGRDYGPLTRLTLSYDGAFMILLGLSLTNKPICYETKRCCANPLKKCRYCKEDHEILHYASAVMILLGEAKIRDDCNDEHGIKRLICRCLHLWYRPKAAKAAKRYPLASDAVEEYLKAQSTIESHEEKSLDAAAEPTAHALLRLFSPLSDQETVSRIVSHMGYLLGKWIYLADAVRDAEEDKKRGNYNPLLLGDGSSAKEKAEPILNTCLVQLAKDHDLLPHHSYLPILENILFYGLPQVQKSLFKENTK